VVAASVPGELADLIERIARHPHGLGFLHRAYLESVAVTLGVHPFVVDAARAYLETADGRTFLIEAVRRAGERAKAGETAPAPHGPDSGRVEAGELIRKAEGHPRGVRYLAEGAPAEIAAAFDVHPYLVFRARGILDRHEIAS
jgi:hypothetical protein